MFQVIYTFFWFRLFFSYMLCIKASNISGCDANRVIGVWTERTGKSCSNSCCVENCSQVALKGQGRRKVIRTYWKKSSNSGTRLWKTAKQQGHADWLFEQMRWLILNKGFAFEAVMLWDIVAFTQPLIISSTA